MNNQNGINEQNGVVAPVGVVENNSFLSSEAVTTPHDLSRIQDLVNQLESNIQKINDGDLEKNRSFMDTVYQNSIENGRMKQTVQGEFYVGINPTLAKFVEEASATVLQILKKQLGINEASFSNSKNQGIPSLELTTPTLFGESKEVSPAPIEISGPPLRPENIFDDEEVLGEENGQQLTGTSY